MTRVLVVDDEPGLRQSLGLLLADAGYDVAAEGNGTRALDRALAESFDLVLCDVRMPEMDGLAFLRAYKGGGGTGLVIMMSAYGGEEAALAAMKEGAYDYVPKPFRPDEVVLTLRKAEERERLGHTIATLRAQLDSSPAARALIAESPAMRQALETVARVAEHPTTVLITGERGTGKEVIAQAIHRASPRAAGPFVAVNCAAIPDTLLESELFGYVKGAFTGAAGDRPGLFEQADGGTLLLDEVGELPLALQAKLLRVLQENEIRRVGDQKTRRVDVRLLAATAKDLAAEAAEGRFRHDLFDRLNVVAIHLSPLSERRADIAPLARHFAARLAGRLGRSVVLSDAALEWLGEQSWPGNVRSLEHAIERAAVLSDKEILEAGDFVGPRPLSPAPQRAEGERGREATLRDAVERAERDAITAALRGAAAIQRGCRSVLHFTGNTVWVTTACPTTVDTISGVQDLYALFKVTMSASRDSVQYDPRGLSMDAFPSNTVARLTGSVTTNQDSDDRPGPALGGLGPRSEEHTSELQSPDHLVCRLLLEKKNKNKNKQ